MFPYSLDCGPEYSRPSSVKILAGKWRVFCGKLSDEVLARIADKTPKDGRPPRSFCLF
jgi:hypothetical protein